MIEARKIPRAPGYLATPDGQIIGKYGRPIRPAPSHNGYLQFGVFVAVGQRRTERVHVAVCEAFHGPRPPGHEVAHLNGNRQDNRAINLAWKTRSANHMDKLEHGTSNRGENHYKCKLTDQQVREIRESELPVFVLAKIHGMAYEYIRRVKKGIERRHVI